MSSSWKTTRSWPAMWVSSSSLGPTKALPPHPRGKGAPESIPPDPCLGHSQLGVVHGPSPVDPGQPRPGPPGRRRWVRGQSLGFIQSAEFQAFSVVSLENPLTSLGLGFFVCQVRVESRDLRDLSSLVYFSVSFTYTQKVVCSVLGGHELGIV